MSVGATGRSPSGDAGEPKGRRQVVKFSFFRIDPAWRALPDAEREAPKAAFPAAVQRFTERPQLRTHSVVGLPGPAAVP